MTKIVKGYRTMRSSPLIIIALHNFSLKYHFYGPLWGCKVRITNISICAAKTSTGLPKVMVSMWENQVKLCDSQIFFKRIATLTLRKNDSFTEWDFIVELPVYIAVDV